MFQVCFTIPWVLHVINQGRQPYLQEFLFSLTLRGYSKTLTPPPQAYCNMGASCFVGDNIHLGKKRDSPYPHGVLSIRNIWKKSRFKIKRELGVCCKHDQMRMPRIAFPLVGGARHLIRELTSLGNENVHMPQRIPTKCWRENLPSGIWPAIFFFIIWQTRQAHTAQFCCYLVFCAWPRKDVLVSDVIQFLDATASSQSRYLRRNSYLTYYYN